jgi:hypothetical protein
LLFDTSEYSLVPDEIRLDDRRLIRCDVAAYLKAAFDTNHAASKMAIVDDMFYFPKENQQRRTIE